jgi:four helix bundle protein
MIRFPFTKLQIWQKDIALVDLVYEVTEPLPKTEYYGLRAQMRAFAVSVPSNIVLLREARKKPIKTSQISS